MTIKQAKDLLFKIACNPGIADQFTEKEIEELENIVNRKQ